MFFRHARIALAVITSGTLLAAMLTAVASADPPPRPNIIMIIADDMSTDLLQYMRYTSQMADAGFTFTNYFDATPWCCPSRATIQTGKYPHNTHVRTNNWPNGGFGKFLTHDMDHSIGVQLQDVGYRTGLMGKYLNDYRLDGSSRPGAAYPSKFVPPGWDDWFAVGDGGYQGFAYAAVSDVSSDHQPAKRVVTKGSKPTNYLTDVLSTRATDFIADGSSDPFFLMVTPFAPHHGEHDPESPSIDFPPAPRDRPASSNRPKSWPAPQFSTGDCGPVACADVPFPDPSAVANFNVVTENAPSWMPTRPITPRKLDLARTRYLQRIQAMQSIDDMVGRIRLSLAVTGQAANTWIMFSSDNGYHLGEHAMPLGKSSAYDHDVRVPLIVLPPAGSDYAPAEIDAFTQNTDLVPTALDLAAAPIRSDVDGASFVPLFSQPTLPWRGNVLLEFTNDSEELTTEGSNPDIQGGEAHFNAPTYHALRARTFLYVDYSRIDGSVPRPKNGEYYDLIADPGETHNIFATLSEDRRVELNAMLRAQAACAAQQCRYLQGLGSAPAPSP